MKPLLAKILVLLLTFAFVLSLVACNTNDDNQTKPTDTGSQQQTDNTSEPDDTTSQGDNAENNLLSGTYKVARKNIYVDTPNYNMIEEGYTRIFLDGSTKYVTFTCVKSETAESLEDAHAKAFDRFKSGVDSHHHINDGDNLQTVNVTVNSVTAIQYEGTVSAGNNPVYDAYTYGYSFIFEGLPCAIIGVVHDEDQPEEEKQLLKEIVDEMMKTVRNSK
ncbi:MAG: hypothetical protein IJ389_03450 [Clostridia bacterium]|nr:hypothetical protein [Clostridia bacterium]